MQIVKTRDELRAALAVSRGSVGLVPTMGALHAGHLALIAAAQAKCDYVVVSIFVNPTQFTTAKDLASYPRDEEADLHKLEAAGCAAAWLPGVETIYPPGDATAIDPAGPALALEAIHRPGHFRGMTTVVAKLFGLVRPDAAFFGEKDWQQLQVVRRMVADLILPVRIVGVETVREADGLALSSRNRLLNAQQRAKAPALHASLRAVAAMLRGGTGADKALARARAQLTEDGFGVNYIELVDSITLRPILDPSGGRIIAAAQLGPVRLLDNIAA